MSETAETAPSLGLSLVPVVALVALLYHSIAVLDASGHLPLIGGTVVAGLIATFGLGKAWSDVQAGMIRGITAALPAVLVLMVVGLLVGSWIAAGVVPLLISWGLAVLSPSWFLLASCLVCAIVALATGSSWSTAATVGLALVGVGDALGVNPGMTAGAIVSGSYFGDKMSPLSDTTNLAPASAGSELFEHIQHMAYTTVPGLLIALVLYAVLGFGAGDGTADSATVDAIDAGLKAGFSLSPLLLLAPATVLALIVRKVPALPALLAGVAVGGVLGLITQAGHGLTVGDLLGAMYGGYESATGVAAVDDLLSRGGLTSMLETVALIVVALAFAGVMESSGMLDTLARTVLSAARSTGGLIAATVGTALGLNVLASDQYIAIVVPGRMYRGAYLQRGLHPKNLSRALEDAGTLTSALVPWNTCGAYMAGVLGVATLSYAPYAFLNLIVPVLSIAYGFTGFSIAPAEPDPA